MRSFVSISTSVLILGSCFVGLPVDAADVFLDAGPGIKWVTPTQPNGNPVIPFKKGDVLIVRQAETNAGMSHGFRFNPAVPPIPLCDPTPPAPAKLCLESPYNRNFSGPGSGKVEILRLKALEDLQADMPFECSVHGGLMKGTLKK
jgi:hypothetical protein